MIPFCHLIFWPSVLSPTSVIQFRILSPTYFETQIDYTGCYSWATCVDNLLIKFHSFHFKKVFQLFSRFKSAVFFVSKHIRWDIHGTSHWPIYHALERHLSAEMGRWASIDDLSWGWGGIAYNCLSKLFDFIKFCNLLCAPNRWIVIIVTFANHDLRLFFVIRKLTSLWRPCFDPTFQDSHISCPKMPKKPRRPRHRKAPLRVIQDNIWILFDTQFFHFFNENLSWRNRVW